jgi:hypothetical protein
MYAAFCFHRFTFGVFIAKFNSIPVLEILTHLPVGRYFIRKSLKMFKRLAADLVFMLKICAH